MCGFFLASCSDDFLDTSPTDAYSESFVFSNYENYYSMINGVHKGMASQYNSQQDESGQGTTMMQGDILGEDVVFPSTSNGWYVSDLRWNNLVNDNSYGTYWGWYFYYKIIGNVNDIINNIDGVEFPSDKIADKDYVKGQALAYRAYSYHYLLQYYAKRYQAGTTNEQLGVPLNLESSQEGLPRSTVEVVYEQIWKDLDEAIVLLKNAEAKGVKRSGRIQVTPAVTYGIMARVALTQQNWAKAAEYASAARTASNLGLPAALSLMNQDQLYSGFNSADNPEWMWGWEMQPDQTLYFYSFFAYMSWNFNSSNIRGAAKCIFSPLYNKISATDYRKKWWLGTQAELDAQKMPASTYTKTLYMNKKFAVADPSSSVADLPFMRLAEMYLIEAEAKARLGSADAADVLFQFVSKRDPEYVRSTKTGQDLVEEVLTHRRVELWGEGFRWFDLKRMDLPLDRTGGNTNAAVSSVMQVPAGDLRWQYLIPRREIQANPAVEQNPTK